MSKHRAKIYCRYAILVGKKYDKTLEYLFYYNKNKCYSVCTPEIPKIKKNTSVYHFDSISVPITPGKFIYFLTLLSALVTKQEI